MNTRSAPPKSRKKPPGNRKKNVPRNPGGNKAQNQKAVVAKSLGGGVPRPSLPPITQASVEYLKTLLQPCSGSAKIPDLNCVPTTAYTVTKEIMITTAAAGTECGVQVDLTANPSIFVENNATTSSTAFTYLGAAVTDQAGVTYTGVRLVSACLDVTYTGSNFANQGMITGWVLTSVGGAMQSGPGSISAAMASRLNETYRASHGVSLFYRPSDSTCYDFRTIASTTAFGGLGFHVTGAANSAPFHARLTLNYEAIPAGDTSSWTTPLAIKPSPIDPIGQSQVINLVNRVKPIMTRENAGALLSTINGIRSAAQATWPFISGLFKSGKMFV